MKHPSFSPPCCALKVLTVVSKTWLLMMSVADSIIINVLSQFWNICCGYQNTHWKWSSSFSINYFSFSIKEFIEGIMVGHSSTKQTTKKGRKEVGFWVCPQLKTKIRKARTFLKARTEGLFEVMSSSIPWLKKIIWVIGVLRRTVVCDWRFDNPCWSHLQSQVIVLVSWKF